jgi:hypothetical protein
MSIIATVINKFIKKYLGWDTMAPSRNGILTKSLASIGIYTYVGMFRY